MARKFSELEAKMSPEARAEIERETRRMLAEIKRKQNDRGGRPLKGNKSPR
jgi:hypothetical protein